MTQASKYRELKQDRNHNRVGLDSNMLGLYTIKEFGTNCNMWGIAPENYQTFSKLKPGHPHTVGRRRRSIELVGS